MPKQNLSPNALAAKKTKYLATFRCRFKNVVISQYKPYSNTLQKHTHTKLNKQKVNCKLWTDEHIKTSTKNLQFSGQNSSWKTPALTWQFCHRYAWTCFIVGICSANELKTEIDPLATFNWWTPITTLKPTFLTLPHTHDTEILTCICIVYRLVGKYQYVSI
jgi:hypothetical protein